MLDRGNGLGRRLEGRDEGGDAGQLGPGDAHITSPGTR